MTKHRFFAYLTRIHRWAGLIIGLQIILWTGSGLFMTVFPIEQIRGNSVADKYNAPIADFDGVITLAEAANLYPGTVNSVVLASYAGHEVYEMGGTDGLNFINANTGDAWKGLSEGDIIMVASHYHIGDVQPAAAALLTARPQEYGGDIPVWQVSFDDGHATRLYIGPEKGELRATRTRLWRVYDIMWMLHIMDYKTRDNFNSWWLRLAAFAGLTFSLTGAGLLLHRFVLRPRPRAGQG